MIKNYMEILVDQVIEDLLAEPMDFACKCDTCLDSIRAIALNSIKPLYITSKMGEVFGRYYVKEVQNRLDIFAEVIRAKEIVEKNPKH